MKALLWKELCENVRWAAIGFVATAGALLLWLWQEHYSYSMSSLAGEEMLLILTIAAPVAGLALGLLQTLPEVRQSQWAFLVHRGVSPGQIFAAKIYVGLSLYTLAILAPYLLLVLWLAVEGDVVAPFHWAMAWPGLSILAAGAGFYFAGMLIALRPARWYASRLLPLLLPGICVAGLLILALEMQAGVPFLAIAVLAGMIALLALAARSSFLGSGEVTAQPRVGRAALGATLSCSMLVLLFIALASLVALELELFHRRASSYERYAFDLGGHLWHFEQARREGSPNLVPVKAQDLDAPGEQREEDPAALLQSWKGLPLHYVHLGIGAPGFLGLGRARFLPVLRPLAVDDAGSRVRVYSPPHGMFLGYRLENRPWGWDTRLVQYIGPDGFFSPPELPRERFGRRLDMDWHGFVALENGRRRTSYGHYGRGRRREIVACEEAIYDIDFAQGRIEKVFSAPPEDPIRGVMLPQDDGPLEILIAQESKVRIFAVREEPLGTVQDYTTGKSSELKTFLPDREIASMPLLQEARALGGFAVGRLPDKDLWIFHLGGASASQNFHRFLEVRPDGAVVRRREFPRRDAEMFLHHAALVSACIPIGLAAPVAIADELGSRGQGIGPGAILRSLRNRPGRSLFLIGTTLVASGACAWAALRLSKRHGFGAGERRTWVILCALLGPAGLLALFSFRDWQARLTCTSCGKLRPVHEASCWNCSAPFDPPARDGTEIFEDEPPAALAAGRTEVIAS